MNAVNRRPAQFSFAKLLALPLDGISRNAYNEHVRLEENIEASAVEIGRYNRFVDHNENLWVIAVIDETRTGMTAQFVSNNPEISGYKMSVGAGLQTLDDDTRTGFRANVDRLVNLSQSNPRRFVRQYCQ